MSFWFGASSPTQAAPEHASPGCTLSLLEGVGARRRWSAQVHMYPPATRHDNFGLVQGHRAATQRCQISSWNHLPWARLRHGEGHPFATLSTAFRVERLGRE